MIPFTFHHMTKFPIPKHAAFEVMFDGNARLKLRRMKEGELYPKHYVVATEDITGRNCSVSTRDRVLTNRAAS